VRFFVCVLEKRTKEKGWTRKMSDDDALFGDAEETASAATADSAATAAAVGAVAEKRAAKKRRREKRAKKRKRKAKRRERKRQKKDIEYSESSQAEESNGGDDAQTPESEVEADDESEAEADDEDDTKKKGKAKPDWPRTFPLRCVGIDTSPETRSANGGNPAILFALIASRASSTAATFRIFGDVAAEFACPLRTFNLVLTKVGGVDLSETSASSRSASAEAAAIAAVGGAHDAPATSGVSTNSMGIPRKLCDAVIVGFDGIKTEPKNVTPSLLAMALGRKTFHPPSTRARNGLADKKFLCEMSVGMLPSARVELSRMQRVIDRSGRSVYDPAVLSVRNAYATETFFKRSLLIGGDAVRAIPHDDHEAWAAIEGTLDSPFDHAGAGAAQDPLLSEDDIEALLRRIYHANTLTSEQEAKLLARLHVDKIAASEALCNTAQILSQASRVFHVVRKKPGGTLRVNATLGAWPQMMQDTLRGWDLSVTRRGPAWWVQTAEAIESERVISSIVGPQAQSVSSASASASAAAAGALPAVQLVRAEYDCDPRDTDGFVARVREVECAHASMVVLTSNLKRRLYLADHFHSAQVHVCAEPPGSGNFFVGKGAVWIDRAHELDVTTISALVRQAQQSGVRALYVSGSTWASSAGSSNGFKDLFVAAGQHQRSVARAAVPSTLFGDARDKIPDNCRVILRRPDDTVPPAWNGIQRATIHGVCRGTESLSFYTAMCALNSSWTRGDLMAIVMRCALLSNFKIVLPQGRDWRAILK